MIDEILLPLLPHEWEQIKSGNKTIIIQKTKPMLIGLPFRAFVYLPDVGVVGCFDCNMIAQAMPDFFAPGACITEEELNEYAAGSAVFGWYIKANSAYEYEAPIELERGTGSKTPPQSWQYLRG